MNPIKPDSTKPVSATTPSTLSITRWTKKGPLGRVPITEEDLLRKLPGVTALDGVHRDRLARRILAGFFVCFELRPDVDPRSFVDWLTQAGASVSVHRPDTAAPL